MPAVTLTDSDFIEYDASNPLPVTPIGGGTGGAVEVEIANGADVALGSTTDDAYTGTEPYTLMSAVRAVANAAISTAASPVAGDTANDAVDAGNPVKMGGVVTATSMPNLAAGDRTNLYATTSGILFTSLTGTAAAGADTGTNAQVIYPTSNLSGQNPSTARTGLAIVNQNFDGTQWIRTRSNTVANGGAALTELGPYTATRVTTDGQIKSSAGFVHTVTFSPTGTVTAGTISIYNNTAESGTIILSVALPVTTFTPFSVVLDAVCGTGIYVGYDGTVANVQVTVSYR